MWKWSICSCHIRELMGGSAWRMECTLRWRYCYDFSFQPWVEEPSQAVWLVLRAPCSSLGFSPGSWMSGAGGRWGLEMLRAILGCDTDLEGCSSASPGPCFFVICSWQKGGQGAGSCSKRKKWGELSICRMHGPFQLCHLLLWFSQPPFAVSKVRFTSSFSFLSSYFKKIFIWPYELLVAACEFLVEACGI